MAIQALSGTIYNYISLYTPGDHLFNWNPNVRVVY